MKRRLTLLLLGIFILAIGVAPGFSQSATASSALQGTVSDQTGALVPNATITITSKETGATRSTTTSDTGQYRFELLPVGTYSVKTAKNGFSSATIDTLRLVVAQTATVNFSLKPGTTNETVEVTTQAPLIEAEKTDVSMAITPREVQDLPLNGRDFGSLAVLAPGARPADSYDPTKNRIAVFSVNGGAGRDVNVTVNGVDNKDNTVGGPVMQLPLEAVQEFNISTERFSAANGRSEGAAVNVITKSGSNNFHGSGYLFDTETALNAKDFFTAQDPTAQKKDYSRQQFGGSIGGPVRKDQDFLFFALERVREHTALAVNPDSVAELQLMVPFGARPTSSIQTPYFDWRYTGRYDHHFNSNNNFFITYNYQTNTGLNDQDTNQTDLSQNNFTTNRLIMANATLNSVLSPRVVNAFTFGHQYWNNVIDTKELAPRILFPDGTEFGTNTNVSQQSIQKKWQFRDDVSITHGNHGFKTGADFVWEPTLGGFFTFNQTLELDFADDPATILNDKTKYPNGFASPNTLIGMSQSIGDPKFFTKGGVKTFGIFFQDDWKARRNLTLNLGVRWDKDIGFLAGDIQQQNRTFLALKAINNPLAASLPHDYNGALSPRVGFAWDVTGQGRHVVRGGYGLYYGQTFLNIPLFMIQQANPTIFGTVLSLVNPNDPVPGTGLTLSQYTINDVKTRPPVLPGALTTLPDNTVGRLIDPSYRPPYSQQFNGGYSFALNENNVVEIEYVHTLSLHTSKTVNVNPTIPGSNVRILTGAFAAAGQPILNRIDDEQSIDRSRYDGLNVSYRRRMSKRLSINTSYVLSRAVCYYCTLGANAFRNRPTDPFNPIRPEDFGFAPNDERHRWTFSGVADLPFGIQVAPILQLASARPFNAQSSTDFLGFGQSSGVTGARPALVPINNRDDLFTFAGNDGSCLTAGTCTFSGFNTFRGQAFFNVDLRVAKGFKIGESKQLKLISQFFDLTNRSNFGGNFVARQGATNVFQPSTYITPSSVVIPQSFRAEFGAEFRF